MRNITYLLILISYLLLPVIQTYEPDTTCSVLDNKCIQYIKKELGIIVPVIVVEDPQVNAWTNGVTINITTGILEVPGMSLESIKMILLHENGHIINHSHDVRDLYLKAYEFKLRKCQTQECRDNAALRYLKEAREDEYRCDSYAIRKAYKLKLDAEKTCYVLKVFAENNNYNLDDTESTHPSSVDRYKKCVVGVTTGIIP